MSEITLQKRHVFLGHKVGESPDRATPLDWDSIRVVLPNGGVLEFEALDRARDGTVGVRCIEGTLRIEPEVSNMIRIGVVTYAEMLERDREAKP